MLAPPVYDEIDRICAPQIEIDIKTFLRESPCPPPPPPTQRATGPTPPDYDCTVYRCSDVLRKVENRSDDLGKVHVPFRRNWVPVTAVVRGTKLEIYKSVRGRSSAEDGSAEMARLDLRRYETTPTDGRTEPRSLAGRGSRSSSSPAGRLVVESSRELLEQYSLLDAVAGVACDYVKRENVLRIRAGLDQFLLQCEGSRDAIEWLESIQKGAIIAEPLESRDEPVHVGTPRRRRTKTNCKNQPHQVFEAASADAPLRPRTTVSAARRQAASMSPSMVRSVTPLNRLVDAAQREATARRNQPRDAVGRDNSACHRRTGAADVRPDLPSGRTSSVKERTIAPGSGHGRGPRSERFVCPVLEADYPRKAVPAPGSRSLVSGHTQDMEDTTT